MIVSKSNHGRLLRLHLCGVFDKLQNLFDRSLLSHDDTGLWRYESYIAGVLATPVQWVHYAGAMGALCGYYLDAMWSRIR